MSWQPRLETMTFCVPFMMLSSLSYTFRQGGAHRPLHLYTTRNECCGDKCTPFWGSIWNTARKVVMSRESEIISLVSAPFS